MKQVGALDPHASIVVLAVVAAAMSVVAAFLWLRRRPSRPPDPARWAQEPAEPWGSVILGVFLIGPVVGAGLGAIGLASWTPAVLAVLVVLLLAAAGVGRTVRSFSVGADGVRWRVLFRRRHAPLADVVGVANPGDPWVSPRVWLTGGGVIDLPDSAHLRVVVATLAGLLGHTWHEVPFAGQPRSVEQRADRALSRRLRAQLGVAADEPVVTVGSDAPFLSLVDRAGLLRSCRATLDARGVHLRQARPPGRRRASAVVLDGTGALEAVTSDEAHADEGDHWWTHDLVWSDEGGATQVVAFADLEGDDLWFVAWGPGATAVAADLGRTLAAHRA